MAAANKSDKDVTLPKVVAKTVEVVAVQSFGVYQGKMIVQSFEDESLAHAVANRLKADLVHRGVDINDNEHRVEVRAL